jgi:hypothetical protein
VAMNTRSRAARSAGVLTLVVILALGVSCSDNGSGEAGTTTFPQGKVRSSATTADPRDQDLEAVRAAYNLSSRAFIDAAAIPDPNFAALSETHTGLMLEQRQKVLAALKRDGRVIRYPANSKYRVEINDATFKLDGDVAIFEICGVDDGQTVVAQTGQVISGGVGSAQARVAMKRGDGVWKLAERELIAEWKGIAGCAAG